MTITFLDVGQGDATLIETPKGNKILIDVGPDGRVLNSLSKELHVFDKNIAAIFITHADLDHAGGIVDVLGYFNVSNIYISKIAEDSEIYKSMYSELEKHDDVIVRKLDGSNQVVIDKEYGVVLDILSPIKDYPYKNRNDKSFFMKLTYEDNAFIFSGDAGVEIEEYIIRNSYDSLDSDVLKIGHHGSSSSTSLGFIKAISPKYGIISSEKDNEYGHPHQDVLDLLEEEGVIVKRNDEIGNISFISDGKNIFVR